MYHRWCSICCSRYSQLHPHAVYAWRSILCIIDGVGSAAVGIRNYMHTPCMLSSRFYVSSRMDLNDTAERVEKNRVVLSFEFFSLCSASNSSVCSQLPTLQLATS
ncbi:hypothetical protein CBR_g36741 [Chara braunii]|uniref:Uncharacterized protein n=1 Tax=Chara braunii TaxID=69332 RepID=A0A388LLK8_CHABU|nr:hypothetical protein CBR_g36741 [Chara braunii]|eukprot:GBG83123.1 hypothetical protein CBR_g36741 [Chara braunii]